MRNRKLLNILLLIILTVVFASCKKNNPAPEPTEAEKARDEFYNIMKDWYLWYDKMPDVNLNDYHSPEELLEALRYKPLDKWSFITTVQAFQSYFKAGEYVGFGFGYSYDESGNIYIAFVFKDSELYTKGVRRGWQITAVNGTPLQPFTNLSPLMGEDVAGLSRTFTFIKPDTVQTELTVIKDTVSMNAVLVADTLHVAGHTVGHLVFQTFVEPAIAELDSAFSFFKSVDADRLIVDLRYNGGGDLDVANKLASLIAGSSNTGRIFIKFSHTYKMSQYDVNLNFTNEPYALSLNSVIFLTSRGSASASESLISGLKPYMNEVLIGDNTYGKPVGMHTWLYNNYAFVPVSFRMVNADGESDYYDGLPADDIVADGLKYDFSDRREDRLSDAIYYIENGTFPAFKKAVMPNMPVPYYTGLRLEIGAL
ncbi:MAG: hypothetical protein GXO83_01170 [Chlorobi bacterium]|nr:hypothetical protein [Chlorobiota bacterium]